MRSKSNEIHGKQSHSENYWEEEALMQGIMASVPRMFEINVIAWYT